MTCNDEDRDRSRRPGTEDRGWSHMSDTSVAGRSRGRVVSCVVCIVHVEMRSVDFLVEPQNQGRRFISGLTSKPLRRFLIGLGLKIDGDGL
jgi:hypothetical protein